MEYYLAFKNQEIQQHVTTWMTLEDIILSEISHHWRTNTAWFHIDEVSNIVKLMGTESQMVAAGG